MPPRRARSDGGATAWFKDVFGFEESTFAATRSQFSVEGSAGSEVLVSKPSGTRFEVGPFKCPSLKELRDRLSRSSAPKGGRLSFKNVAGDVVALHADRDNDGAVFQVASQFNCLEMTGPGVRPEDGISIYAYDRTQGPACAMSCPAATAFRNYMVNGVGQGGGRQLDLLSGVAEKVENSRYGYWEMRNGYCLPEDPGAVARLGERLRADGKLLTACKERLRVGVHWSTAVTSGTHSVCQVFCSALPVAYATDTPQEDWESFACVVLDAAYDATLAAAAILARERQARVTVYLTALGGGAFGNATEWITAAIGKAIREHQDEPLDVELVHFRAVPGGGPFIDMEEEWKSMVVRKRPAAAPEDTTAEKKPRSIVMKRPAAR